MEKEKRKHDVELEQLKQEVRIGNRKREPGTGGKRGENWVKISKEFGEGMDEMREEACKRGEEARKE